MKYYVITGGSQGLGAEFVKLIDMESNKKIISISRTKLDYEPLTEDHIHIKCDLSDFSAISKVIDDISSHIVKDKVSQMIFINNAGSVDPIGEFGDVESVAIKNSLVLNAITPIVFINEFIKHFQETPIDKRVINITSGAARKAIRGLAAYSAGKSAVNKITEIVAQEQQNKRYPIKISAISPGMIETATQKKLRETEEDRLSSKEIYLKAYESGKLLPPEFVAGILLDFAKSFTINGLIVHIKDLIGEN